MNIEARPCSCHWLNPVSVIWGSVSSWSLDCVWHLAFVKADVVFFLSFLYYTELWTAFPLTVKRLCSTAFPPFRLQLQVWHSCTDKSLFYSIRKGRNTSATVPSLSEQENEATSLVKKSNSVLTHLKSREQGKGSWLVCAWKRFQDSTMLISASLKQCLSAASQALARQQTLTRIKTDNLEKKKFKKTNTKKT